jgi:DNA repair exonuclease SbcCD ATPase subunit
MGSLANHIDTPHTGAVDTTLQEKFSKLEKHNTILQSRNADLKDTVDTLTKSFEAVQEKLKLQAQLHADQLRTLQAKDKVLTERCQSTAAFAEQHRLAGLHLEQKHKSLQKDLQSMAALQAQSEGRQAKEIGRLESSLKSKERDCTSLQQQMQTLHTSMQTLQKTTLSLKQEHKQQTLDLSKKLESVSGSLEAAKELLRSYPQISKDGIHVLKSSAEVLQLTHSKGGVESMRDCLGQVSAVLDDLHADLQAHSRLAGEWTQRADRLLA